MKFGSKNGSKARRVCDFAHPFIMKKTYTTDRIFGSMERQRAIVKKCIPLG